MFFWFVGSMLATWRVTHLLVREKGPLDILSRGRRVGSRAFRGGLLTCFDCTSLWIAIPFAFVVTRGLPEVAVVWLALSGGTILLDRWSRDPFQDSVTVEDRPTS